MSKHIYFRSLLLIITTTLVAACGGGGRDSGSDNSGGGITTIEVTDLPRLEVNEGQQVTLSLNPKNTNGASLTYDWGVSFQGQALTFSGQNTPTIRFTAPQVTGSGTVSISVNYDLANGNLLGNTSDFTSVTVLDTSPPPVTTQEQRLQQVAGSVFDEDIQEVEEFTVANLGPQSTWAATVFLNTSESDAQLATAIHATAYIRRNTQDVPEFEWCGSPTAVALTEWLAVDEDAELCPNSTAEFTRYQDEDTFELRASCDNTLFYAAKLERISDGIRQDYGQVTVTIDDAEDLSAMQNVCFQTLRGVAYNDEAELEFSTLEIETQYQNEPLKLVLADDSIQTGFNFAVVSPNEIEAISLQSPLLPELSVENFRSGGFRFERWEIDAIEGEFDASFNTGDALRDIEGTFLFNRN